VPLEPGHILREIHDLENGGEPLSPAPQFIEGHPVAVVRRSRKEDLAR
jgi:hypothetical protein